MLVPLSRLAINVFRPFAHPQETFSLCSRLVCRVCVGWSVLARGGGREVFRGTARLCVRRAGELGGSTARALPDWMPTGRITAFSWYSHLSPNIVLSWSFDYHLSEGDWMQRICLACQFCVHHIVIESPKTMVPRRRPVRGSAVRRRGPAAVRK